MKPLYRVSAEADADLGGIWRYIARDKPGAASKFLGKLKKYFLLLARHPFMGESRDEVMPNLRSFPVGSYAIYYQPCQTGEVAIDIIRVLHAARDIQSIFG